MSIYLYMKVVLIEVEEEMFYKSTGHLTILIMDIIPTLFICYGLRTVDSCCTWKASIFIHFLSFNSLVSISP